VATLPLRKTTNPRMYKGLTVKTPGCVAFSLPVQRRNFRNLGASSVFPIPPQPAQRAADTERRSSPSGVRSQVTILFQGRLQTRHNRLSGPQGADMRWPASALALCRAFSDRQGGAFCCRQCVQTGRRLMRQTVLPTTIQGRTAPTRSESSARRSASPESRSERRPVLRFGLPLTPESGGPSRHPAARYALTVIRARRRQESQNAQQNVDRCYPPGRDPGRRGPRQSRRRV
jgi:hypothetical protein